MRDIAVVGFGHSPFVSRNRTDDMAGLLFPVLRDVLGDIDLPRDQVDFVTSGSHDFHEGRTFAYIDSLDAVGAWPPIVESHVEMDAAWAFYEAWAWLQLGYGETAVVYGIGRGGLSQDLDQVVPTQLDPYLLTPLRPHQDAIAGLQADALLRAGITDEAGLARIVNRSWSDASARQQSSQLTAPRPAEVENAPYVASPLRRHDVSPVVDAAAVVVLAAGDTARRLAERPAWVRGADHRIDGHYPGSRDLTTAPSARLSAARASELAGFGAADVDLAELHTEYSHQEPLLVRELGLGAAARINPSGGPLTGRPVTATGLIRVGEAARAIHHGESDRALAHATNGQALQQNLVCLLEGDAR